MMIAGLCVGATVVIAQYVGSKKLDKIQATISTLLISLVAAAILITVVMLFLSTPILKLINTPAESFSEARKYLDITVVGIIFIFLYNALSAIMRGMGDSKTPMVFVTIACITNIILDYVLVGSFGMGASGAAIATVFSQALSMVLCIIHLKRRDFMFDFKLSSFKFDKEQFKLLIRIGLPLSVQNVINSISFMFLTSLVNTFGVMASSGVGIVNKFNSFAIMPALAVSSSVSTLSAQNMGANRPERVKKTLYTGIALAFAMTSTIFVAAQLFPEAIISVFDKTPEMIQIGAFYMRFSTFDYLIIPFVFCLNGLINGSGHSLITAINNICAALLFRIPLAYLLSTTLGLGLQGVALASPLSSLGAAIISIVYFLSGKWKKSSIVKDDLLTQAALSE
jgi:putative MATE family efflux protein